MGEKGVCWARFRVCSAFTSPPHVTGTRCTKWMVRVLWFRCKSGTRSLPKIQTNTEKFEWIQKSAESFQKYSVKTEKLQSPGIWQNQQKVHAWLRDQMSSKTLHSNWYLKSRIWNCRNIFLLFSRKCLRPWKHVVERVCFNNFVVFCFSPTWDGAWPEAYLY